MLALRRGFPKTAAAAAIEEGEARRCADEFLREQGFDLARYEAPEMRRVDFDRRTDLVFRYRSLERAFGDEVRYGVAVTFAGDQLGGFAPWREDPAEAETTALFQPVTILGNLNFFSCFLVLPFVAVFFLKRYHAGEIGVARGLQIFATVLALTLVVQFFVARAVDPGPVLGLADAPADLLHLGAAAGRHLLHPARARVVRLLVGGGVVLPRALGRRSSPRSTRSSTASGRTARWRARRSRATRRAG